PVQARPYAQAARDRVGPHRFGGARQRLQALAVRRGVLTLFAARAKPEQPPDSGTSRLVLGPGILALQQKRPRRRRARRRVTGNPAQGSVSLARRDRVRTRPIDSRLFPSGARLTSSRLNRPLVFLGGGFPSCFWPIFPQVSRDRLTVRPGECADLSP